MAQRFFSTLKTEWKIFLAVSLAGLLTYFAFAPYRYSWIMPVLLSTLFYCTLIRPQYSVLLAFIWGFCAYLVQNYWVNISLHEVAGLSQVFAIPMTALFAAYLALYPALVFALLRVFKLPNKIRILFILPILWVLSEFLREHLFTGFGWGAIGYSQVSASPLAGWAPIGGLPAVSLALALVCGAITWAIFNHCVKQRIIMAIWIIIICGLGYQFKHINFTEPDGSSARVALIQGNVPQQLKFDPQIIGQSIQMYYNRVATVRNADLIILPESAIPVIRQTLPVGVIAQFASAAQRSGADLAISIIQETSDGTGYENVVLNLADFHPTHPQKIPYYAKHHLVPFGEFRPIMTGWLYEKMHIPMSDFSRGGVGQEPLLMAKQRIAFNICYEDSFGAELIAAARKSSLLANVSNMGWFGSSNAMDLQLQHSQTRALELGRYMVRATNNGMTAVIMPNGKISALIPRDTEQTLIATVQGYRGQTPYMKIGAYTLPLILLMIVILALFLPKIRTTKDKK